VPLYLDDERTGNNSYWSDQFQPATCASQSLSGGDRSFEFTAPAAGTYTFSSAGSDYDTVLYLLDTCGGTELACDDDGGPSTQSELSYTFTAGQTVVVVLDGYSSSSTGNFELVVE